MPDDGEQLLDRAFDGLERQAPDRWTRAIQWARSPASRWVRLPLGLLLIAGSFFFVLPILGLWMAPVGLLLLAQDLPILRKPVARALLWTERKWTAWRRRAR